MSDDQRNVSIRQTLIPMQIVPITPRLVNNVERCYNAVTLTNEWASFFLCNRFHVTYTRNITGEEWIRKEWNGNWKEESRCGDGREGEKHPQRSRLGRVQRNGPSSLLAGNLSAIEQTRSAFPCRKTSLFVTSPDIVISVTILKCVCVARSCRAIVRKGHAPKRPFKYNCESSRTC